MRFSAAIFAAFAVTSLGVSSVIAGEATTATETVTEPRIVGEPVDPNEREVDTGPAASESRHTVTDTDTRVDHTLPGEVVERPPPREPEPAPRPEIFDQVHKQIEKQQQDGNVGP